MHNAESAQSEIQEERASYEIEQDIRDIFTNIVRRHSLPPTEIFSMLHDLRESPDFSTFQVKLHFNTFKIEAGSEEERLYQLLMAYYKARAQEEAP